MKLLSELEVAGVLEDSEKHFLIAVAERTSRFVALHYFFTLVDAAVELQSHIPREVAVNRILHFVAHC